MSIGEKSIMEDKVQLKTTRPNPFQKILHALQTMNEAGKFQAAVLTSGEGLPIITVPTNYDSHVAAAIVAMLRRISDRAENQLGMAEVDEVTIRGHDRVRLVCRYLPAGEEKLILAVIVPPGHSYRRVTNRAVRQITRLLR
jgi:predicted regulator of Ras-like GTPase activity (Roadblock/LC7/MglB family)